MIKWSLDSKSELKTTSPSFTRKFREALLIHLSSAKLVDVELKDIQLSISGDSIVVTKYKQFPDNIYNKPRKIKPYAPAPPKDSVNPETLQKLKPLIREALHTTMQNFR